jgi:hypothetical protein
MITPSWADYGTHDEAYYPELWHRLEFASCPALGGSPRNLARQGIYTQTAESGETVINGVMARSTQTSTLVTPRRFNIFSVVGWVYVLADGNYYSLIDLDPTWGAFKFHTSTDGTMYAGITDPDRVVTASGYSVVNRWLMYGYTTDAATQTLFKNDYQSAVSANYHRLPSRDVSGVYVGHTTPSNNFYFANVMVWDRVISREEIALLAQNPTIAYTPRRRTVRRTYSIPDAATFNPAWARHSNIYIPAGARLA